MTLSAGAKADLAARETDTVFITLITITHAELGTPIRVCNDAIDCVSRGNTFQACTFRFVPPNQDPDTVPRARLQIDNVDRQIVQAIRTITSKPSIMVEVVRDDDPDTVEMTLDDFQLEDVTWDQMFVTGDVTIENFLQEPYPAHAFVPSYFPGMF